MREFTLLIQNDATMDGLTDGETIRGSGMMGACDLTIVFARKSGGGFLDEGHMLHVRAGVGSRYFSDDCGFDKIRYGHYLQHEGRVTQTRRLR